VVVAATLRDKLIDIGSVQAGAAAPGVIHLAAADEAMQRAAGVARITVFDEQMNPLAERLTFRNRRERLSVTAELDSKRYAPRGQVALTLTTRDSAGKPVPAELALSVVDDTVIAFADDKSGHLLSKLLLEPELPGKVEEPNFYLDLTEAQSALALDLLMGTRGYRRFEWMAVLSPRTRARRCRRRCAGSAPAARGPGRRQAAAAPRDGRRAGAGWPSAAGRAARGEEGQGGQGGQGRDQRARRHAAGRQRRAAPQRHRRRP
jgi:hypothetical protein